MKTADSQTDFVRMPHDLLTRAQAVADEEHRTTDELMRDALQRYLDKHAARHDEKRSDSHARPAGRKNLAQLFAESPFKGLGLKFERDSDTGRPVTL